MTKETVLESIVAFIFGHRYYANIVSTRGTGKTELTSFIHPSRETAEAHRREIEDTRLYRWEETVSFRSRRDYGEQEIK